MGSSTPSRRTVPGDWHRRRIVRFLQEFGNRKGHPSSLREIAGEVSLAVSTVSYHLSIPEQDGIVRPEAGQPRTIVQPADLGSRPGTETVDVPLIGEIAAGIPVDALELGEDTFRLPRRVGRARDAVHAQGQGRFDDRRRDH